jgi:hypothetical protein
MKTDTLDGIAVKRIAEVEVRPESSHQHEFNAGALRRALGIRETFLKGKMTFFAYADNVVDPIIDECEFTLYDAREDHPTRSEYRMYYASHRLPSLTKAGDLFVLFRRSQHHLIGILAAKGSAVEAKLQSVLELGNRALERFIASTPRSSKESQAELFDIVVPISKNDANFRYAIDQHAFVKRAVAERRMPPGATMAMTAQKLADSKRHIDDPDLFLYTAMGIETQLFNEIEQSLGALQLQAILAKNTPSLTDVLSFAMSVQQARKSRRGQSLQYHFRELLRERRIPHTAQCRTEQGETPDFIIPSQTAYHDLGFPEERLRMVACKSTLRDRWRQVLNEARRIREKYLLTVDPHIPLATAESIRRAELRLFIPHQIIVDHYDARFAGDISTVAHLLDLLEQAVS